MLSNGADGERGAGLVDALELAVADDLSIRIILFQRDEQRVEGELLSRGAGVGGTAFLVEATLVTDADGVGIIVPGVGTNHLFRTTEMQLAIAGDVVVVAAALPATGLVHLVELLHRDVLVGPARSTVNND